MPQTIILTPEEAVDKGQDFMRLIRTDMRDRKANMDKRAYIRAIYFGDTRRKLSAIGETNIHLHVMTEKIEGIVPKIVNAFWNAEPIVNVRRVAEEHNEELTELNEVYLNWALSSDIPDFYATTEQWFRNMFLDGVSVVKVWWKYETRNTVIIEHKKSMWKQGEYDVIQQPVEEDRPKLAEELLVEIFGTQPLQHELVDVQVITATDELVGSSFRVAFVEDRQEYADVLVEFHASRYVDEIEIYIYRPIVVANRPVIEVVEIEDLIIPYRTADLQSADRIAHQYWLSIPELKQKIRDEGWDITDEDLELLQNEAESTGDRHEQHVENRTLKRQKDQVVGEFNTGDEPKGDAPYFDTKILMYEVYAKDDLSGDGVGEEVIYQIPHKLEKIVKANFLEEIFPHGRRPFCDIHNIRISDRYYSFSYGELLAPINVEVNTIVNQVNEAQELINHPFFFYVPAAMTVDPEVLSNIEYGEGIPIADPQGIVFPQFPQTPLANLSTMDTLLLFADRLTISPQSVGSSQVRNSPRTARGTLALLSEAGVKTDILITAMQNGGWRELIHQTHSLYEAFGPDEKWFYVTGQAKPHRITNKELRGRYEYTFSGNTTNTNPEVMRMHSQVRYTTLAAEPMYMQDMTARQYLIKDFLRWNGEGIDIDRATPQIPGQGGTHPPMDQGTELQIMRHLPLDVLPMDDDASHMQIIDQYRQSKEFEMLTEWQISLVASHYNQHAQQLVGKQQQGPIQAGGASNNVPTGMSLATGGTDLNALEGGTQ